MSPQQKRKLVTTSMTFALIFLSITFLFFSVHQAKKEQALSYENLQSAVKMNRQVYLNEIHDMVEEYDERIEKMGEFVVERQTEFDEKNKKLLELVEKTEQQNNVRLEEFRQELNNVNNEISMVVDKVLKTAVSISTNKSQGSGAIIDKEKGYVITNNHVVKGYTRARIIDTTGKIYSAEVVITDPKRDLAILKASSSFSDQIVLGDSNDVLTGERVVAIGSPEGLDFTVTQGIVSASNRVFDEEEGAYIQTDVPINSGSSGGPLINMDGELIGINTFKIKGSESLGFSIPSNDVSDLLKSI